MRSWNEEPEERTPELPLLRDVDVDSGFTAGLIVRPVSRADGVPVERLLKDEPVERLLDSIPLMRDMDGASDLMAGAMERPESRDEETPPMLRLEMLGEEAWPREMLEALPEEPRDIDVPELRVLRVSASTLKITKRNATAMLKMAV